MIVEVTLTDDFSPMLEAIAARAETFEAPITEIMRSGQEHALESLRTPRELRPSTLEFRARGLGKTGQIDAALSSVEPIVSPTTGTFGFPEGEIAAAGNSQDRGIARGKMRVFGRLSSEAFLAPHPFFHWHAEQFPVYDALTMSYLVGA